MSHTTPLNPVAGARLAESARLTPAAQDQAQPIPTYPASTGRVLIAAICLTGYATLQARSCS